MGREKAEFAVLNSSQWKLGKVPALRALPSAPSAEQHESSCVVCEDKEAAP